MRRLYHNLAHKPIEATQNSNQRRDEILKLYKREIIYYHAGITQHKIAETRRTVMAIKVDSDKCVGCGACTGTCPVEVLEMKDGKVVYKGDGCIECGACVSACPVEALSL